MAIWTIIAVLLLTLVGCGDKPREGVYKDRRQTKGNSLTQKCTVYKAWPFDDAEAKRRQAETAEALGLNVDERLPLGDGIYVDLVLVPAGRFIMGGKPGTDEAHEETLSRPFYIGKYELTWRQYAVFRQGGAATTMAGRHLDSVLKCGREEVLMRGDAVKADCPIFGVSWNQCSGLCLDASKALGCTVRLPTEKEWEFACRAGTTGGYIWADTAAPREANVSEWVDENGVKTGRVTDVQPGGQFRANPWGVYDMVGNVYEWVFDMYTTDEEVRVIRDNADGAPVFWRFPHLGRDDDIGCGFRIAVDIDSNLVKVLTKTRTTSTTTVPTEKSIRD